MLRLVLFVTFVLSLLKTIEGAREYSFENATDVDAFSVPATSTLEQSSERYKDGSHSMKWAWASGDIMKHTFFPAISGNELKKGGIKLWLYNTNPLAGENLTISFQNNAPTTVTVSQFNIKLNFKGWRGVWVSYKEAIQTENKDINVMCITAPTTRHHLYFDVLRFVSDVRRQSRDKVVPTLDPNLYSINDFWQQTYRWSQVSPPDISNTTPSQDKLENMTLIEKRLENWFVDQSQSIVQFPTNARKRWQSLQKQVVSAYIQYGQLNINKSQGVITGLPLYCDKSEVTGGKKFGEVMQEVLLPMTLDYYVRSRDVDVDALAFDQLSNLNGDVAQKKAAIKEIAGGNQNIQNIFTTALGTNKKSYTLEKVKEAIDILNTERKKRLLLLLEYIEDQGWTDGSAIGSLDHEMNNCGAGFMNAVFLLKDEITAEGKIDDYVATMKWYNEFGEVYQDPFEYVGTTADRMRTISLFRLFTVLMMPNTTDDEKLDKIRDMEELLSWYVNGLSPNEAFGGVLKPDYLGFHHNSFYGSAYFPHALHVASLIEFLLSGTPFKLGEDTSKNIKKGLETMRIVAVKYSTPNSVAGRFPGFYNAILARIFPSYAYAGATAPDLNDDGSLGEITILDSDKVKMFLRLYDPGNEDVSNYLEDGTISTHIFYLNTIGSINIMEEISSKAASMGILAESSPQGFWTRNYASLVINRRENWAVTMKGFNKYVWDFEASSTRNFFGLYQSHGALLVANSEASLKTLDIDNGWDWTRHPGTTTIKMDFDQLISDNRRYFQPKELAGGLTLIGGGNYPTGVFGMDFSQPKYQFPAGSFQLDITFEFKKSVFFADFALICLGSGITTTMSSPNITQTTLFQTKLLDASNPSSVLINGESHSLDTDLIRTPSFFNTGNQAATLVDVNGNTYYIPNAYNQGLNVKIGLQHSRTQDDLTATSARYATAWLDHGVDPTDKGYEYTILVEGPSEEIHTLAENQASGSYWYQVLQKDNSAHVVKINNSPRQGETQYGYVFFDKSARTLGPVRRVEKDPCIVMVEEADDNTLHIAVSYPNLNFNITKTLDSASQITAQERFYSVSTPVDIERKMKVGVWLIISTLWLLLQFASSQFANMAYQSDYHITFPERVDGRRGKRDLSTSEKGVHVDDASYRLNTPDKDWTLDIKRNKDLISPSFVVRTFASDGSEVIQEGVPDHCHYQGSIRGLADSTVVLNTCSGLRGLVDDGKDTFYITPESGGEETGAHKIFQANEDEAKHILDNCGNKETHADLHQSVEKSGAISRIRRSISGHVDEFYKPFLTTDETRYNELLLVVDFGMYLKHNNDTKVITDRVITLANAVDAIYQRINIRVVLKALEIWTNGDPFERQKKGGPDLGRFTSYRNDHLIKKFAHDNAQLLSEWRWSDCAGMAFLFGMCGSVSTGVNNWDYGSIIGPYVILAHEMGHNFGFSHDEGSCKCLTPRGCIMGGHKARVPGFSNCSMTSLQRLNDWCLYNVPTHKSYNSYCGNGIREEGEECDCGTPEMCQIKDSCCEPHNCVLKKESQCSDLHHSCCENCLYKQQGSLCRGVKTDCDVPEYCTGNSRDCPGDSYIIDGYPCNQTKTIIQGNTNYFSVNHRTLNPRVSARYLRINPQYWNGWPCLRTEFLGCSAGEVSPTAATPLKSYGLDLCLTPSNQSCSPNDNDRLIYRPGGLCSESHFQFTLDADGVLRHNCSGKMVCPENGGTGNGVKIVVSSTCKTEDSKFKRTSGRSLKHLNTGKCIHTYGAWPGVDRHMVLWSGCDERRLELWFAKQECVDPLGMQSGDIKDSQIAASSSRPADLPHYGRLHNGKYWCAKEKNKNEYIQIDFGQVRTVSKILIQGRGNWYDWVTGFYLFLSNDGQRWTGYSESGDKQHSNSHCYQGKCSEIHETQCKDLWGATANNADQGCYDKLNTEAAGFGTCDPVTNASCAASNVLCGQLQCEDSRDKPVVDYGWTYTKISLDNGKQCSAATLKSIDDLGEGMVREGTKCGDDKMCINYKCQSFDSLDIGNCPVANNKECGGRGVCTNKKLCHCEGGFNSKDGCASALVPRDGAWGEWSSWTVCDKGCDGGKRRRHRFCDNPFPLHGGADCPGDRHEKQDCNTQSCPVVISCHHLRQVGDEQNHYYPDGVYKIYPTGSQPIMAYCDMSRDGGGWTLLVTSHTNTWTAQNVKLRNANSPKLTDNHSILQYADSIKDNINVAGSTFEYRLEAQSQDRWGGIWEAPRGFTFTADNNKQTNIQLVKKFDNWEYSDSGIEQRMPWISDARLTTSHHAYRSWWGTITADAKEYHPAPWIAGHLMESQPSYIWYWMREGLFNMPGSCKEVFFRGLLTNPVSDGVFAIKPPGQQKVKTYCDFTTEGGPWTLLVTSKTHSGWNKDNMKKRNSDKPSLQDDYSILGLADAIKDSDKAQEFFQYRIEADGKTRWGGIWEAPRDYTFLSTCEKQTKVKIVKKFDSWDENSNLGKRMPRLGLSKDLLLSSASTVDEPSGSLVYNSGDNSASYLEQEKPNPSVVRYWMREGARLSCNDLKLHGMRAGNKYGEDSFQLMKVSDTQYLPVYCDMTTAKGGFTLIVTSAHNNWTRAQVPHRNALYPGLNRDYSILDIADSIKSLNNNGTFQYMMDAHSRRHWGGIFEAPKSYSFMASDSSQTHVNLTRKFDNWEYSWWNSLNKRMPWFDAKGTHHMALLTTSDSPTYYPSGSIIWGGPDRFPSDWIWAGGMRNPGVIWYWLNEDDCDEDRKPVDGGLTEWGEWGRCDKLCEPGKHRRYRTCTNPRRRCGGKQCDPSIPTQDEGNCFYCPESGIRSYGDFCVAPNEGGCSPPDGSYLIFTKKEGTACNVTDQIFVLDQDGVIHHKCSKKVVCPQDNNPTYYKKLMLKDKCDLSISKHIRLAAHYNLKNLKHNFCVHPNGGWPEEGVHLNYWPGCDEERLKLNFFKLGAPSA